MQYRQCRTVDCGTAIADDTRIATTEMVAVPIVSPPNRFPLPNAPTELSGQVALVTGATAGLGRRFATVLADAGAAVVVADRRLERLQQVADEITERGDRCAPVAMDLSRTAALSDALDRAEGAFGNFSDDLPRKRIGDPAQLDSTLLYLAAPASEFVTGTVVKVDDGQFPR